MFELLHCRRLALAPAFKNLAHNSALLHFIPYNTPLVSIRSFSSDSTAGKSKREKKLEKRHAFTVSYLVNSYRLSRESAKKIAKWVNFDSPEKSDSVLNFLKNHGFTLPQISKVIRAYPKMLTADTEATLLPKLEFLRSRGFSRKDLAKIISSNPKLFACSLTNRLIPCYEFFKSLVSHDDVIAKLIKRSSQVFHLDVDKALAPKILLLRETGLPDSNIMQLLLAYSRIFSLSNEKFHKQVNRVSVMGFDPSTMHFVQAFKACCHLKETTWERKVEVYKRWGLSEDEVWLAFKKQPICMSLSEKKINATMDFLVNVMGMQPSVFVADPTAFNYSTKRIIPRLSVIRALQLQGLIKDFRLSSMSRYTDRQFLSIFVDKYLDQKPELMKIFEGKGSMRRRRLIHDHRE